MTTDARDADLLELPAPAVLTTYRKDGSAATSPVWFRATDSHLEVVIADGDVKLRHLARDGRAALVVLEARPPFRGVRVEGTPLLRRDGVHEARLAIASRYLGAEQGRRFAAARGAGVVLAFPLEHARRWDLTAILP